MPKRSALTAPPSRDKSTVPQPLGLVNGFVSFACRAGDQGSLPTRILIAKWGDNEARTAGVTFKVGDETVKRLAAEQKRRGFDTVTGDYEHQSVKGHPNFKADPREHWAMGTVEVVKGKGLYYLPSSYTPSGEANARNYPDVSGLFIVDKSTNEVIAVHSVALCQHGMVEGAEFKQAASLMGAAAPGANNYAPYLASENVQAVLDMARDLLELGTDAKPEDITAGLEAMVRVKNAPVKLPEPEPDGDEDGEDTDDDGDGTPATDPNLRTQATHNPNTKPNTTMADKPNDTDARIDKLTATVEKLVTNQESLAASQATTQHNAELESVVAAAIAQGKKIPESLRAKDDAGKYKFAASDAKNILDLIPATEPVTFTTPAHVAAGTVQQTASDEAQIAASLGIKPEDLKKEVGVKHGNQPLPGTEKKFGVAA